MNFYRASRFLLAGAAAVGVAWAAIAFGAFLEQFLAGAFGGGIMAAVFLLDKGKIP